jgi:hypothetical protein
MSLDIDIFTMPKLPKGCVIVAIAIIAIGMQQLSKVSGIRIEVFGILLAIIFSIIVVLSLRTNAAKYRKLGKFLDLMEELGCTNWITVFEILNENSVFVDPGFKYCWSVGIWLNYDERFIVLREDKDSWEERIIPFDNIQSVEIIVDGHTQGITRGIGVYGVFLGGTKFKEIIERLQVRIVAGNSTRGTKSYILNLYDSTTFPKGINPNFEIIQECARRIVDEINYV